MRSFLNYLHPTRCAQATSAPNSNMCMTVNQIIVYNENYMYSPWSRWPESVPHHCIPRSTITPVQLKHGSLRSVTYRNIFLSSVGYITLQLSLHHSLPDISKLQIPLHLMTNEWGPAHICGRDDYHVINKFCQRLSLCDSGLWATKSLQNKCSSSFKL